LSSVEEFNGNWPNAPMTDVPAFVLRVLARKGVVFWRLTVLRPHPTSEKKGSGRAYIPKLGRNLHSGTERSTEKWTGRPRRFCRTIF
jgi:hypothetical protein